MSTINLSTLYCASIIPILDDFYILLQDPSARLEKLYLFGRKIKNFTAPDFKHDYKVPHKVETFHQHLEILVDIQPAGLLEKFYVADHSFKTMIERGVFSKSSLPKNLQPIQDASKYRMYVPLALYENASSVDGVPACIAQEVANFAKAHPNNAWVFHSLFEAGRSDSFQVLKHQIELIQSGVSLTRVISDMEHALSALITETSFCSLLSPQASKSKKNFVLHVMDPALGDNSLAWRVQSQFGNFFFFVPSASCSDTLILDNHQSFIKLQYRAQLVEELNQLSQKYQIKGPQGNILKFLTFA